MGHSSAGSGDGGGAGGVRAHRARVGAAPTLVARVTGARLSLGPSQGAAHGAASGLTLVQEDPTTCGATCLLAARLLLAPDAGASVLGALADRGGAGTLPGAPRGALPRALPHALRAEQLRLQAALNRRAGGPLGPVPWTGRLGSTPWAVARAMTAAVRATDPGAGAYTVRWVRDHGGRWPATATGLRRHLAAGHPVLLLSGGPLTWRGGEGRLPGALRALTTHGPAVPRHYVLALPWALLGQEDPGPGRAHVYDPASGAVDVLDLTTRWPDAGPGPRALGGWTRVLAVITPKESTRD